MGLSVGAESFCLCSSPGPEDLGLHESGIGWRGRGGGGRGVGEEGCAWFSSPKPGFSKTIHPAEHRNPTLHLSPLRWALTRSR